MDEIHYLLGNSCDLNCDFCFWDMRLPDISLLRKKRIIDEVKDTGIKKLTISGGEPTFSHDFLEVLEYCQKNGLEVILHTHGLRINKKMAKRLSHLVSRISLSLDGSNEEEYEDTCSHTFPSKHFRQFWNCSECQNSCY